MPDSAPADDRVNPATDPPPAGPIRVLYVHHAEMVGGAAESLLVLLRHLPRDVIQPHLLSPADGLNAAKLPDHVEHHHIDRWDVRWSLNPLRALDQFSELSGLAGAIRTAAADTNPDIIHANTWPAALAATVPPCPDIPLIWHARDLKIRPVVTVWLRARRPRAIAISNTVCEFLRSRGFARNRISVVYNGIDPEGFRPSRPPGDVRLELDIPADAPLVCSVARPVPWKGHELLLQAAARIHRRTAQARFIFVGGYGTRDRQRLAYLRRLAAYMQLDDVVRFTGHREDVPDLIGAADVFAHAAIREPLGRVVMEAMLLGKPVVVPASAGPDELVENGKTGLTVRPGDPAALADGILRMLDEPEMAAECANAARRRIVTHFSAEQMAQKTIGVYQQVLGGVSANADRD